MQGKSLSTGSKKTTEKVAELLIHAKKGALDYQIELLEKSISDLCDRLLTVSQQQTPTVSEERATCPVPFAEELAKSECRLRSLNDFVRDMICRLEI